MSNTFGRILRLTTFGESHGPALGGVLDGMPAGLPIRPEELQAFVNRRSAGSTGGSTQRREPDQVEVLSGIYEGVTLGTPIGFIVRNTQARSGDYEAMRDIYRPSHADYTYQAKYGLRDHRGGGRASARETVSRMVGGGLAMQLLQHMGVTITAFTSQIGSARLTEPYNKLNLSNIDNNSVRCPHPEVAAQMVAAIEQARSEGDTLGGAVTCVVRGVPAGVGEPVFGKLNATLGAAMMSINAAKAFEVGSGCDFAAMKGSEALDLFEPCPDGAIGTATNHSGGVQGGISNGEDIYFKVTFKPVATLMRDLPVADRQGHPSVLHPCGRHDVCVVPRAVPIVEAMAALTLADTMLLQRAGRL